MRVFWLSPTAAVMPCTCACWLDGHICLTLFSVVPCGCWHSFSLKFYTLPHIFKKFVWLCRFLFRFSFFILYTVFFWDTVSGRSGWSLIPCVGRVTFHAPASICWTYATMLLEAGLGTDLQALCILCRQSTSGSPASMFPLFFTWHLILVNPGGYSMTTRFMSQHVTVE